MADTAKILVVEDEADTVGLLELTLRTAAFEMQTAHSGQEGLRLAFEKPYDLILLDLMMPDISRIDVLYSVQFPWEEMNRAEALRARGCRTERKARRERGCSE